MCDTVATAALTSFLGSGTLSDVELLREKNLSFQPLELLVKDSLHLENNDQSK